MCKLCNALINEKSEYFYEDKYTVILKTKNMKGHRKRFMLISKEHTSEICKGLEYYYRLIFINFCKKQFQPDTTFCLFERKFPTIKEHWHIVASDWKGDDLIQMLDTPHYCIETNDVKRIMDNVKSDITLTISIIIIGIVLKFKGR